MLEFLRRDQKAKQLKNTLKKPWLQANEHGERPGYICCQRACGRFCYEHDPSHYVLVNGQWKIKE